MWATKFHTHTKQNCDSTCLNYNSEILCSCMGVSQNKTFSVGTKNNLHGLQSWNMDGKLAHMLRNDKAGSKLSALNQIVTIYKLLIWLTARESSHYLAGGTAKGERFALCSANPNEAVNVASCTVDTLQWKTRTCLVSYLAWWLSRETGGCSASQKFLLSIKQKFFCRLRRLSWLRIETSWASYIQIIT